MEFNELRMWQLIDDFCAFRFCGVLWVSFSLEWEPFWSCELLLGDTIHRELHHKLEEKRLT